MDLTRRAEHSLSKMILCRSHCDHCKKTIRFFGLRCRLCRMKFHKNCSHSSCANCFPTGERKSKKHGLFHRPFRERYNKKAGCQMKPPRQLFVGGNQRCPPPYNSDPLAAMEWKLGQQTNPLNAAGQNGRLYPLMSNAATTTWTTQSPTRSAFNEGRHFASSPTELNLYAVENLRNAWHLSVDAEEAARYISTSCPRQVGLASVVSSGYSSVNQSSCSSSAGTGSQRSRSPTPDQFETVREECTSSASTTTFGDRLVACDVVRDTRNGSGFTPVDQPGDQRRTTQDNTPNLRTSIDCKSDATVKDGPLFFIESDDDSSGEWEEHENCHGRLRPRPGLQRALEELEIRYSDVAIEEKVGVGPNGPVYRGRWHGEVMVHTRQASKKVEVEEFRKEVALLSMIRHENVMLFMGACLEPPNLAVVTSLRKCVSIHNHLHCQESRLTMATRLNVMLQVAQGMSYLHAKRITVPCLRTMNIYLESKVKLCINDYTYLHHQVKRDGYSSVPQGHLTYLPPEVISRVRVDLTTGRIIDTTVRQRPMDVYAYGTVLYEILTDKWPFANLCPETVIWMIGKGLPQSLAKVKGPDAVKDLIKSCWSLDPTQRPSFVHIIQILKQANSSTNYIARRHSVSEPEKMQCFGRTVELCHVKRI